LQTTEEAARSLALPIVARVEVESVEALLALRPTAFADANAVVVMQDGMFWNHRRDVLALVISTRLPAIYAEREFADDGGLIAYGANISDNFHRAASYVDRILKTRRLADSGAGEVRFHRQPEDRTRAWPDDPPAILVSADEVIE
jgi:putative ABC transport system substrate-binding protein